jgi:hypothetical protein
VTSYNALINRLFGYYGAPRNDEGACRAFLAEYTRALAPYSFDELNTAADRLIEQRPSKTWPTISDCLRVLRSMREAKRTQEVKQARELQRKERYEPIYTPQQMRQFQRFVDECASGSINMGRCHKALQELAVSIRNKRLAKQREAFR